MSTLKEKTKAKIALCSIPILGEDTTNEAYTLSKDYSEAIKELANYSQVEYLPVNEKMVEYLEKYPSEPKYEYTHRLVEKVAFKYILLGIGLDKISEQNKFHLLVDHIHLNTTGAEIVANLIIDFVNNSEKNK